jgi:subtilase family serine protease
MMMSLFRTFRATAPARQRRHARLRLEHLEPRNLLSVSTPAQIATAYAFNQATYNGTALTGAGQTIAIVDAYDDPNAASDLAHFSSTFGLPQANFTKATPQGTPAADSGWSTEISLDIQWAHAMAPGASIMLVEAKSNSLGDLLGAVDYARNQAGVSVVSMSWGGGEFSSESYYDSYFTTPAGHTGVTFIASSGDNGAWYGPEWPASSPNVIAVGGTTLNLANTSGTYGSERGWSGSGGGYSSYENEPSFQKSVQNSGVRTTPDVSYDANPNTGFYVYQTYGVTPGWYQVGGTSAGAPQWASLVALANEARFHAGKTPLDGPSQTLPALYSMSQSNFHDATSGSNGYSAHSGYDLVTGRGSPVANLVIQSLANVGSGTSPAVTTTTTTTTTTTSSGSTGGKHGSRNDQVGGDGSPVAAPVVTPTPAPVVQASSAVSPLGQAPYLGLFASSTQGLYSLLAPGDTPDARYGSPATASINSLLGGSRTPAEIHSSPLGSSPAHAAEAVERVAAIDQAFLNQPLMPEDGDDGFGPDGDADGAWADGAWADVGDVE